MNIQRNINKLLIVIKQKGKNVKIESKTYFSENSNKYITKYSVYERLKYKNKYGEEKEKWLEINNCYGKTNLLKYLVTYYRKIEGEAKDE